MSVLDRYIVRAILGSVLLVMLVLLLLGALFVFIDQQDDIGTGHYTALGAFWYTLLNLPQLAYELLPITALIGSLLGLGALARGSELTVIRASGVSIVRLAGIALMAGLLLMFVELLLGELPADIRGTARITRAGQAIWEKPFLTGEANMSHSVRNLEHHHFKYDLFRRPGDVHVHFFGTATLSFADGIKARDGDVFEIEAQPFQLPLRNPLKTVTAPPPGVRIL